MANNIKQSCVNQQKIKQADLIVGIPSYNEADNIGFVAEKVDFGLTKFFPGRKSVIINCDNYSPDGTQAEFLKTKTKTPKIYISTPKSMRGKGYNFYNLFNEAARLNAKAVAVVDADLLSIKPNWMNFLLKPILKGYDYVTPYYARSEYDGSITNHICYPLIYGLFGRNIRQPIGGDFSFSPKLAAACLNSKWHSTTYKYGIDIFMTMTAILNDLKIAQTGLGAKIHKPSAPKLGPMFSQVVTTLFKNIENNKSQWLDLRKEREIPFFGKRDLAKPQTVSVDYKGMKATSVFDFSTNSDILKKALSGKAYTELERSYGRGRVEIDKYLWTKIIYDMLYAYIRSDANGGLVEALKPLYFGRFVSFFKETMELPFAQSEREITEQAEYFWKNRGYLIRKYKKG
ncbi:MAG: glycosyl transferase [bacterium]|nr:glycosyl transferase [bacterium]